MPERREIYKRATQAGIFIFGLSIGGLCTRAVLGPQLEQNTAFIGELEGRITKAEQILSEYRTLADEFRQRLEELQNPLRPQIEEPDNKIL